MGKTRNYILQTEEKVLNNEDIGFDEAVRLMGAEGPDLMFLFASANRIREKFCGNHIHICGIVNAKSGACSENCVFCSQSARNRTRIETYKLMDPDDILEASRAAAANGAQGFGIVAAWRSITRGEALDSICTAIRKIRQEGGIIPHVSLGIIDDPAVAEMLAEAGAEEYNINLETARSFFPKICTTHGYDDRIKTVKYVKAAGMRVCCGGIFGLGESREQRVELAMELRELEPDTTPLNFYHHTEGNNVDVNAVKPIEPLEALKIAAVFRFVLPGTVLKIAGGRETTLGEFQSMMFLTGLNSCMVGDYLTTRGRDAHTDMELIRHSGMSIKSEIRNTGCGHELI
jgi:biotin synthase